MKQYKVKAKAKEFLFDTIKAARECRARLREMGYRNISIIVEQEDVNPYNKIAGVDFSDSLDKLDNLKL